MPDLESLIDGHHARNKELLELIASKGADPNVPRDIDLHFWASSEDSARSLSAAIEARGYSLISVNQAVADHSAWNIEVRIQASPVSVAAAGFVDELARLADAHSAEFDGWGTAI